MNVQVVWEQFADRGFLACLVDGRRVANLEQQRVGLGARFRVAVWAHNAEYVTAELPTGEWVVINRSLPGGRAKQLEQASGKGQNWTRQQAEQHALQFNEAAAATAPPPVVPKPVAVAEVAPTGKRIAASEKQAVSIAKQIEKDLGKAKRREFHDRKEQRGVDRTLAELKADAAELYTDAGKEIPGWLR